MKVTTCRIVLCALLSIAAAHSGQAQEYVVAVAEENFRSRPNGAKLGTLKQGTSLAALREEGRWVKASLRGWIWKRSIRPGRDRSTVIVDVGSENLRGSPAPGGRLLGTVLRGTALRKRSERKGWVRVSYDGWIWEPSLAGAEKLGARKPGAGPAAASEETAGSTRPPALTVDRTIAVPEENLRSEPNGRVLGKLRRGADLAVLQSRGGWLKVATRGYFYAASASGKGGSRKVAKPAENLRMAPASEIVGVLQRDTQLEVLGRAGGWLEVELRGWIWEPSTLALAAVNEPEPGADGTRATSIATESNHEEAAGGADRSEREPEPETAPEKFEPAAAADAPSLAPPRALARSVPLKDGPDGTLIGHALAGSSVVPVRESGDWVKVRVEGWVPKEALAPPRAAAGPVTVPMAIAQPEAYRGAEATWRLELIAVERSEGARNDFTAGEHYLLTRHAEGEREYVYVTIPEGLVERFRKLRSFTPLTIRGVVRTGRSALVGNPILEFRELLPESSSP